jgi:hypothetical protein
MCTDNVIRTIIISELLWNALRFFDHGLGPLTSTVWERGESGIEMELNRCRRTADAARSTSDL